MYVGKNKLFVKFSDCGDFATENREGIKILMIIRNFHQFEIPHKRTHKARTCACSFSFVE